MQERLGLAINLVLGALMAAYHARLAQNADDDQNTKAKAAAEALTRLPAAVAALLPEIGGQMKISPFTGVGWRGCYNPIGNSSHEFTPAGEPVCYYFRSSVPDLADGRKMILYVDLAKLPAPVADWVKEG